MADSAVSVAADESDAPVNESHSHRHSTGDACCDQESASSSDPQDDVAAAELVINAFHNYKYHGRDKIYNMIGSFKRLSPAHQKILTDQHSAHVRELLCCIDHNHRVLKQLVAYGADMFGEETARALRITQRRPATPMYMGKVQSTLKQIVREWSVEGFDERRPTYEAIESTLVARFPPATRESVRVLVPGAGLGRLAWDLVAQGFTVQGNEYSLFMLLASCYMLNHAVKEEELTIYPWVLESNNHWSYADRCRPVKFPDICPAEYGIPSSNTFSMCAGEFMATTGDQDGEWSCVATAWFVDTAHNVLDYVDHIWTILKPGGVWVNAGPLTWHYADSEEMSIELPYDELKRVIEHRGFRVEEERRIPSGYTGNPHSMLNHRYECAFFVAVKDE